MKPGILHWSAVAIFTVMMAGCGGGGATMGGNNGGGDNSPTTVTLSLLGVINGIATRIGSNTFVSVPVDTTSSSQTITLTLPDGETKYSLAVNCIYSSSNPIEQNEAIFNYSTLDTTAPIVYCTSGFPSSADADARRTPLRAFASRRFEANANPLATGVTLGELTGTLDTSAYPSTSGLDYGVYGSGAMTFGYEPGANDSLEIDAPSGSDRVFLALLSSSIGPVIAAKNFDNQTVPGALNGGNTVVFGSSDAAVSEPISYSNVPPGYGTPTTSVGYAIDNLGLILDYEATTQYSALPAGVQESGDYYELSATTGTGSVSYGFVSSYPAGYVAQTQFTSASGPASFSFVAPWTVPAVTASATPTFTFNYTGFTSGQLLEDASSLAWQYYTSPSFVYNLGQIYEYSTANYMAGQTSLTIPDLSSLTGMLALPPSGTPVLWQAEMSNAVNYTAGEETPVGTIYNSVGGYGTYTEP